MSVVALASLARAARVPPDYREALGEGWARQIEALARKGRVEEAVALGERLSSAVEPLPAVEYELGLIANQLGDAAAALTHYGRAIEARPDFAAPRYDRGELLLLGGDLDAAAADFAVVARVRPEHWAAHFRLAHVAAARGDPAGLERHLLEALRHGFDFRAVLEDPSWQRWARDPAMGPVIGRLIGAYSDERLLEELRLKQDAP